MKMTKLKRRLTKDRAMTTISLRIPKDVVDDLKHIAEQLGFSDYRALIRAYVGRTMHSDLEALSEHENEPSGTAEFIP